MHVIFIGWNRSVPGREQMSAGHFGEMLSFLGGLQQEGLIHSFEPVLLTAHGGDLNGFMLIRGERAQLSSLAERDDWEMHLTRAGMHLENLGVIAGVSGETTMEWIARWNSLMPG